MDWLLIATGFTGGLTVVYLARLLSQLVRTPPAVIVHGPPFAGVVQAELRRARREVLFYASSCTHDELARSLADLRQRRVKVEILLGDTDADDPDSRLAFFAEQGLKPGRTPDFERVRQAFLVIDGRTLLVGSFDFTARAEQDPTARLMCVRGQPEVVSAWREVFRLLTDASASPAPVSAPVAEEKPAPSIPEPPAATLPAPAPLPAPVPVPPVVVPPMEEMSGEEDSAEPEEAPLPAPARETPEEPERPSYSYPEPTETPAAGPEPEPEEEEEEEEEDDFLAPPMPMRVPSSIDLDSMLRSVLHSTGAVPGVTEEDETEEEPEPEPPSAEERPMTPHSLTSLRALFPRALAEAGPEEEKEE